MWNDAGTIVTAPLRFYARHDKEYSLLIAKDMDKQQEILNSYYKFMIYRNPAERLFSAFRDKIEKYPLAYKKLPFHEFRVLMYKYNYPGKWNTLTRKGTIHINFVEFVKYWTTHVDHIQDPHFLPMFSLCQPCQMHFNYYGKFSTFEQDVQVLMNHVGSNTSVLDASYYESGRKPSSEIATDYYKLLTREQKEAVIKKLAVDLLFYYTIFPEERDSHKVIMDTDIDVPDIIF